MEVSIFFHDCNWSRTEEIGPPAVLSVLCGVGFFIVSTVMSILVAS